MKKKLFLLLVLLLPVMVYADTFPKVLTLNTTLEDNTINFSGTTESGSHATMCKLLNATNKEIDMLSVAVDNNEFEGTFIAPATGNYTVSCANYEGGEIKTKAVTVESIATYTVTFNSNGGSEVEAAEITAGDVVAEPTAPTWDGHTFDGWYEDNTLTTPFDFTTRITGDITLYAGWLEDGAPQIETTVVHTIFFGEGGKYQVDFETDDSEHQGPLGAPITNSAVYNVPVDGRMTVTAIPDENHYFKGWYSVREVDIDGEGHMEWEEVELLSSESSYNFMPTGSPYIKPVFEENEENEPIVVKFVTNCDDTIEDIVKDNPGPIEEPRKPVRDDYNFNGWYEDSTFTTRFDFERDVNESLTLYAKWIEAGETYTVTDEAGNIVVFKDEEDREFELVVTDIMQLSDEELTERGITEEVYAEVEAAAAEAVKEYGTMLAFYDINIVKDDGTLRDDKPLEIKLPITKEMEKYNSFKLVYVDIDKNFNIETVKVIDLEVKDGYLVGELPHLSNYILTGTVVETSNPKTADTLYMWVSLLMISLIGVTSGVVALVKRHN